MINQTLLKILLFLLAQFPVSHTISNEKIFRSTVYLKAIGNPSLALNEKEKLEESFLSAYTALLNPICSFRLIESITLVDTMMGYDIVDTMTEYDDIVEGSADFNCSLQFDMMIRCYDCSGDAQLFDYNNESKNSHVEDTCYWSYNSLVDYNSSTDDLIANIAPLSDDFLNKFNEVILNQRITSINEAVFVFEDDEMMLTTMEPLICPCPEKSFCHYTNMHIKDFWKISDGLFYNCTCMDGFHSNDGWNCKDIDECQNYENYPCAPPEEGGFCVNTHPDDTDYSMYKCGCQYGYKVDESYPEDDRHGVKHCLKIPPSNCSDDSFSRTLTLNVSGNPFAALDEKGIIEKSLKLAYERSSTSSSSSLCQYRSLENVTLNGILSETGEFINVSETTATRRRRYLEDNFTTGLELSPVDKDNTNDDDVDDDDVDDYDNTAGFDLVVNFNFSFFFSMIMRCYGCPEDARLFNDASRRKRSLLRGHQRNQRNLQDNTTDTCSCELDDSDTFRSRLLEEDVPSQNIVDAAPSLNDFLGELQEALVESGSESIENVTTLEDTTVYDDADPTIIPNNDNADTSNNNKESSDEDQELSDEDQESPVEEKNDVCPNKCNEDNQKCVQGLCACKAGYVSFSGRGGRCHDIKECKSHKLNKCHKKAKCEEIIGSYGCSCIKGYDGDGFSNSTGCTDINECKTNNHKCNETEVCTNKPGFYECVTLTPAPSRAPTPVPRPPPETDRPPPENDREVVTDDPFSFHTPNSPHLVKDEINETAVITVLTTTQQMTTLSIATTPAIEHKAATTTQDPSRKNDELANNDATNIDTTTDTTNDTTKNTKTHQTKTKQQPPNNNEKRQINK